MEWFFILVIIVVCFIVGLVLALYDIDLWEEFKKLFR